MLANKVVLRQRFWICVWACAWVGPGLVVPALAGGGIEALNASTPTVRLLVPGSQAGALLAPEAPAGILATSCSTDTTQTRFEAANPSIAANYLNAAAFFDARRRTSSKHYFIKYFDPDSTGWEAYWASIPADSVADSLQIVGMSFRSSRSGDVFPSAGVVKTSAASPFFPRAWELGDELQEYGKKGEGKSAETCVDFSHDGVFLKRGQAAWAVLRFPDAADTALVGILVDKKAPDHSGDFLSPDGGDLWYRPDPSAGSAYDWAITVYYRRPPSSRPPKGDDRNLHWAEFKKLYR